MQHLLEQAPPALESAPARKMSIEHGAGMMPHFGKAAGIRAKAAQRVGKKLALAGRDDHPAIMPPDKARDFAVARGDRDDRSAGGGDPVELARHDQAFELGPQRNQMDVGNAKGKL